jgi:hypothetical protein
MISLPLLAPVERKWGGFHRVSYQEVAVGQNECERTNLSLFSLVFCSEGVEFGVFMPNSHVFQLI